MEILLDNKSIAEKIAYVDAVERVALCSNQYVYTAFHNVIVTDNVEFDVDFYIGDPREVDWDYTQLDEETVRFKFDESDIKLLKECHNSKELNQVVHKILISCIEKLNKELSDLIGAGYVDFQTMIYYNNYTNVIRSWKNLRIDSGWQIKKPNNYGATDSVKQGDSDWGVLQFIWGTAVYKFGDYGTSPRVGWIDIKEHPEFYEWIDAVCFDDISNNISVKTKELTNEFRKVVKNIGAVSPEDNRAT